MIGPVRGGRVTTVTGVPSEPLTFYMGTVGGGVWKTTDAGHTWLPMTDGQISVGPVGAVEVSQSNPKVIYAGTGSSKIRSNISIGHGIYKSVDAGKTWTFIGLRDVGQIATIRVDPGNPDLVFVAVSGNPFVPNKERGLYRSNDGGKTWKQVLFLSDKLGAADVEFQPGHPNVVFASIWYGQRKPWTIITGSDTEESTRPRTAATRGRSSGRTSKSAVRAQQCRHLGGAPNRVYALVEAKPGSGLYRSDDVGATWTLVNELAKLTTRPFYYSPPG